MYILMYMYIYIYIYILFDNNNNVFIYIYIYIERERDVCIEGERRCGADAARDAPPSPFSLRIALNNTSLGCVMRHGISSSKLCFSR